MTRLRQSALLKGLVVAFACATAASAASVVIGDFETGTLTGWTTFTTTTGTIGTPAVVPFDTNGNATASNAAQFNVGQAGGSGYQGGGIYQDVNLTAGAWTLTADIASEQIYSGQNADGGLFELLFDSALVDSHDFGVIPGSTIERAALSAFIPGVSAGLHEVRFRITRSYSTSDATPYQYIDDVVAVSNKTEIRPVPEPGTFFLLGGALVLLAIGRRKSQR